MRVLLSVSVPFAFYLFEIEVLPPDGGYEERDGALPHSLLSGAFYRGAKGIEIVIDIALTDFPVKIDLARDFRYAVSGINPLEKECNMTTVSSLRLRSPRSYCLLPLTRRFRSFIASGVYFSSTVFHC